MANTNTLIQEYNTQKCKAHPKLQIVKTRCDLFREQIRESKYINSYHRYQLLNKLAVVYNKVQNYEINRKIDEKKFLPN